ncbi:hypothetical protein [Vulgatibacter sp.]|uniref:hypothetical protein n=1 Tax=Vulgatibacter sp. TaxID=1971226 RepID=UPI0035672E94
MTEMDSYRLSPGGFRPIFVRQALLSAVAIAALAFVAEWARPSRDELLPLLAGLVVGAVALGLGLLLRLQHRRWRGWRLEVSPAGGRLWHEERLLVAFEPAQVRALRQLPSGAIVIDLDVPPGAVAIPAEVERAGELQERLRTWRPLQRAPGARLRAAGQVAIGCAGAALLLAVLVVETPRLLVPLAVLTLVGWGAFWLRARRDRRLDQASRKRVDGTTFSVVLLVAVKLAQVLGG